jgi:hypothetical protein
MHRFSTRLVLAIAAFFLFASISPAQQKAGLGRSQGAYAAAPSDPVVLANQAMIHAQGEEATFVALEIGVDPSSPLNYSSYVDPEGQSFAFSLNAGSTYLGQPFALAASGTLNPSTQTWNVSTSGSYGGAPWEVTSTLVPTIPPNALGTAYHTVAHLRLGQIVNPDEDCTFDAGNGAMYAAGELCHGSQNGVADGTVWFVTICEFCSTDPATVIVDAKTGSGQVVWDENVPYWGFHAKAIFTPGSGSGSFVTTIGPPLTICQNCNAFFSDLSPIGGSLYQCCYAWEVSGSEAQGGSYTAANLFAAGKSGSVSQIDVAVGYSSGVNSFYVSIWTNNNGLPGTQLARWSNLSSDTNFGGCCGLVTISGISGLSLTAGQSYFMVLGPENIESNTQENWNLNSLGVNGLDLYSTDGGTTWNSNGPGATIGAFDILGSTTGDLRVHK